MTDTASGVFNFLADAVRGFQAVQKATSYCDYIAHRIAVDLTRPDPERIISSVGDAIATPGSTKKTVAVVDRNGNMYRVTVEDFGR